MTWLSSSALNLSVRLLTNIVRSDSPNLQVIFHLFLSRVINSIRSAYVRTPGSLRNTRPRERAGHSQWGSRGSWGPPTGVPSVTHGFLKPSKGAKGAMGAKGASVTYLYDSTRGKLRVSLRVAMSGGVVD